MMQSGQPEELAPHLLPGLIDFARACRAAARAVSLYPAGHPAILTTLSHLVTVSSAVTSQGAFRVTVLPDSLLLNGAAPSRVEPGITELAILLHRHTVGALVLHGGSDIEAWRTLLLLLARAPEEISADGGIAVLWQRAGGPSIEIDEIDFTEVLREHAGGNRVNLARLIERYLKGHGAVTADRSAVEDVLSESPADLRALVRRALTQTVDGGSGGTGAGDGQGRGAGGFLGLARHLIAQTARDSPDRLEAVLESLSQMAGGLPVDVVSDLLSKRGTPLAFVETSDEDASAGIDVAGAITERMPDEAVAEFVAGSVAAEGRATSVLASAFQAIVAEPDRRDRVLAMAGSRLAGTPAAQAGGMTSFWRQARAMLTGSADQAFVSDAYAGELGHARTRAIDVEETHDDPPARIAAWLETVSDTALRAHDVQLVLDLLGVEDDPERWKSVLQMATSYIDDLGSVNRFDAVADLTEAVSREAGELGNPDKRLVASSGLARLAASPLVRHLLTYLRTADAVGIQQAKRACLALGAPVVSALLHHVAAQQDSKHRRRLQDIVIEFGAAGRDVVQALVNADDPNVRRTAVYLLREFGGGGTLPNLEPQLTDAEPRVQREAIRTIALAGDDRAYGVLAEALMSGKGSRDVQAEELSSLTDERAAPLFRYLVLQLNPRTGPCDIYLLCLAALGRFGGNHAIDALQTALYSGVWWQPFRATAIRTASAEALRRIGTPSAFDVLRHAERNRGGQRRAARRALKS